MEDIKRETLMQIDQLRMPRLDSDNLTLQIYSQQLGTQARRACRTPSARPQARSRKANSGSSSKGAEIAQVVTPLEARCAFTLRPSCRDNARYG